MIEPCCWYCKNRDKCADRCPNDPTTCCFCSWFVDFECGKFEFDEIAYTRLKELIEGCCK